MKTLKNLLLIITLPISITVQGQENKPYLVKSFPTETIKNVLVKTSGGNIELLGSNNTINRVEVFINGNNGKWNSLTKEEITERLSAYDLDISVNYQQLVASAKPKSNNHNWKKQLSISFKIFVAKQVSSDMKTSGGNIHLVGLSGVHNFKTSGGNLQVERVAGDIQGRTSGGNIDVSDCQKNINLETSGGNISAQNCVGILKLNTSGGNLDLGKLSGSIHASTSGGNIEGDAIQGDFITGTSGGNVDLHNLSCSLDVCTSSGDIQVEVTKLSKFVKIRSGGGNVNLQIANESGLNLDLKGDKIRTNALKNFSGTKTEERIEGKLNGGGVPVVVHVSGGNIDFNVE